MAFQAYGKAGTVTAETAREAALKYFITFPKSKKCNIAEGEIDGHFFTVKYGRNSNGELPKSYKDITKKQVSEIQH